MAVRDFFNLNPLVEQEAMQELASWQERYAPDQHVLFIISKEDGTTTTFSCGECLYNKLRMLDLAREAVLTPDASGDVPSEKGN